MSKHGPRYTTAFNDEETAEIKEAISSMARNHNRLIRNSLQIDIDDWRNAVLPQELRDFAVQVQHYYKGQLYDASYSSAFTLAGMNLFADWEHHPQCFPRPLSLGVSFHTDAAGAFVERLCSCLEEWRVSAASYGLLLSVFNWLNNFCGKGERRYLRTLLPNIVPLIATFDRPFAATLAKPLVGAVRAPVPADRMTGLQRANQIIAASFLLPKVALSDNGILLSMGETSITVPEWPAEIKMITGL